MRHSSRHYGPRAGDGEGPQREWSRHGAFGDHDGGFGSRGGGGPRGGGPRGGRGDAGRREGAHGDGGRRGGRSGRARGDVRAAILVLLAEKSSHGYDLIRAIEERSGGLWTPSAGSIYPTLQALEDEGLLTIETVDGRRNASLTEDGFAWVDEHSEHHQALFETEGVGDAAGSLRAELMDLRHAAMHVARRRDGGDLANAALDILVKARKDMYRLLADDEG